MNLYNFGADLQSTYLQVIMKFFFSGLDFYINQATECRSDPPIINHKHQNLCPKANNFYYKLQPPVFFLTLLKLVTLF